MESTYVENPAVSIGIDDDGQFVYVHLGNGETLLTHNPIDNEVQAFVHGNKSPDNQGELKATQLRTRLDELISAGIYIKPTPGIGIQYPPDIYYSMMVNTDRVHPYLLALSKHVRPGSLVVELGAGLGIFALHAARLGADVIVLEPGRVIETCKQIARRNGLDGKVQFVQGPVRNLKLGDRKADLVVSEFIGESFFDERIIQHSLYAKNHLLKPDGRLIPSGLNAHIQGVQSDEARRCLVKQQGEISKLGRSIGFDLSDIQSLVPWLHQNRLIEHSRNRNDLTYYEDAIGITSEELITGVDLNADPGDITLKKEGTATLTVTNDGYIDALYFYFSAPLDEDIALANSLSDRTLFSWPNRFCPTGNSRRFYRSGETIKIKWMFLDWFSRSEFRFIASIVP